MNNYRFELITPIGMDDMREGFPCAFLFTNRTRSACLIFIFLTHKVGGLKPNAFMPDIAEECFNAC